MKENFLSKIKSKVMYSTFMLSAWTIFTGIYTPVVYADNPSDVFKHRGGITKEQMQEGQRILSPFANIIGVGAGIIFSFIVVWQVFQTAIDLLYLYVPILRTLLSPQPDPNGANPSFFGRITTISDDMQKALELNGSNIAQTNMGAGASSGMGGNMGMGGMQGGGFGMNEGMRGGMGMGMGMNGMGMGGMNRMNPATGNAPVDKKNTALTYIKKRSLSLILLMVCIGVLASSALTDSGINLAELVMKILSFFNNSAEEQMGMVTMFFR